MSPLGSAPTPGRFVAASTLLVALACASTAGCRGSDTPGHYQPLVQSDEAGKRAPAPDLPDGYRSLVREAHRAELGSHGLVIDLGTPDQRKYLVGNPPARLGKAGKHAGQTYQELLDGAVFRWHDWWGGASALAVRARKPGKPAALTLTLDGKPLGHKPKNVGPEWTTLVVKLPAPTTPGRRELKLSLDNGPVQVDWLWCRRDAGATPNLTRATVASYGRPMSALAAPPPRTYTYYLYVAGPARLSFFYGADSPTNFEVLVIGEDRRLHQVFKSSSVNGRWTRGTADLSRWVGQTVRVVLLTTGEAKNAAWGEPELFNEGKVPEVMAANRKNAADHLVQVVVSGARRDMFRTFNKASNLVSPAFKTLAARGTAFARAYTNANRTVPSVTGYLSGHRPPSSLAGEPRSARGKTPLLSEILRRRGFVTAAIVASPDVSEANGLNRGWDRFINLAAEGQDTSGAAVYNRALDWLEKFTKEKANKNKRFYLYLHTVDTRLPYRFSAETTGLYFADPYAGPLGKEYAPADGSRAVLPDDLSDVDRRYLSALYRGELTHNDRNLEVFLGELDRRKLTPKTMLVYHADLGAELLERGGVGSGRTLAEEQVRVPLVIVHPHLFPAATKVWKLVSLADLMPTQLQGLGLTPPPGLDGTSMLEAAHNRGEDTDRFVVTTGTTAAGASTGTAVVVGRHKMIVDGRGTRLYNLGTDPGETTDRLTLEPLARRACEVYLGEGINLRAHRKNK